MRCWAVAFAEEDRKVANCGASVTGALGGVGTGGGVCIEKVLLKAGGLADSVGAIGEAGTVDSNGLTGAPEECGEVGATSAASTFAGATTFSTGAFALMAATSGCSEGWTRASTLTGIEGVDTGSARGVSFAGVTGAENVGTTGAASGAVRAVGAATEGNGCGISTWTGGTSCDLAGALVSEETAATCRRRSSTSR
jgi:hypothetical protein